MTLLEDWRAQVFDTISPALFAYEATNVLYRKRPTSNVSGWLSANLNDLLAVVRMRTVTAALLNRGAEIAEEMGLPAAYDSQYAALAESERCEFWTADERFWNAAKRRFPWVRWVGERSNQARP
ncbi:MAG: type II toxin-antitoxin system VapC family toxin [Dehalococcoidia bacterium]